ncbi:Protein kinase OS=Streptomyces tendae OX=1932 GN=GUR47_18210 PE=4 SV=1 [Streptomyces tendae]
MHNAPDVDAVTDPALRSLIADCLAKDPAHRPTPREILARIGPLGGESATALPHAQQWTPAVRPTRADTVPTEIVPPPPAQARTRVDTTRPPAHATAPAPADVHPTATGDGGRPGRRAFLLSGAGALAALGVGTGFWLNRPAASDPSGASDGSAPSPAPSSTTPPPPVPVGLWPLDEVSGPVARDTAGGHDGTVTGVAWQGAGQGAAFDGTGSQIVTDGPVLETGAGRSFTVAAWVRLSAVPAPSPPPSARTAPTPAASTSSTPARTAAGPSPGPACAPSAVPPPPRTSGPT